MISLHSISRPAACGQGFHRQLSFGRMLTVIVSGICLAGCLGEPEESHLEHHAPSHRPATYAEAVEQLHSRIVREVGTDTPPDAGSREFQELRDIIEWLPEIAADSELKKTDWDRVTHVSRNLAGWHFRHGQKGETDLNVRQKLESELAILQSLVPHADRMER